MAGVQRGASSEPAGPRWNPERFRYKGFRLDVTQGLAAGWTDGQQEGTESLAAGLDCSHQRNGDERSEPCFIRRGFGTRAVHRGRTAILVDRRWSGRSTPD